MPIFTEIIYLLAIAISFININKLNFYSFIFPMSAILIYGIYGLMTPYTSVAGLLGLNDIITTSIIMRKSYLIGKIDC